MTLLKKKINDSKSIGEFSNKYFSLLKKTFESIDVNEINKLADVFERSRDNNSSIFVAGNGGSAATATTMANDIGFDIIKKTGTSRPFRIHSLVDNNSVLTAISNDVGYENIFINQLKIHYRQGDSLIVISASGNSPNVLKAVDWVKSRNGKIIGFLGFDGGELYDHCDVKIHAKADKGDYGPVEDAHLIINHILAHWFQVNIKK